MAKALLVYLLVGGAVWFMVDPIRRVLVLPALFSTATRALVVVLLPVTVGVAWRYPLLAGEDKAQVTEASADGDSDAPQ